MLPRAPTSLLERTWQFGPHALLTSARVPEHSRRHVLNYRRSVINLETPDFLGRLLQRLRRHVNAEHERQAAFETVLVKFGEIEMSRLYELFHSVMVPYEISRWDGVIPMDLSRQILRDTKDLEWVQRIAVQQVQTALTLLILSQLVGKPVPSVRWHGQVWWSRGNTSGYTKTREGGRTWPVTG
jgi:hypothetical protein